MARDGLPVGLAELRAAMKAEPRNVLWLTPHWDFGTIAYRCRFCKEVLLLRDASCPTCGAPKARQ